MREGCIQFAAFAAGLAQNPYDPGLRLGVNLESWVSLEKQCVPQRVHSIRRLRGWVGAESIRPRAAARGYTRPQLRCSIGMARRWRLVGLPASTAASQLSPNPQRCKGRRALLFIVCPGAEPGGSHRKTSHRGVEPRTRRQPMGLGVTPSGRCWSPSAETPGTCCPCLAEGRLRGRLPSVRRKRAHPR